ncbi:MAG: hypothetical protein QXQ33_03180 [Nitrososphaerota archaeon]
MEYWIRRGDAEYSFDAPEEALIYEAIPRLQAAEDLQDKLSKVRTFIEEAIILVDFMYPLEPYVTVLKNFDTEDSTIFLTSWRLGDERKELKIIQELKNKLSNATILPSSQMKNLSVLQKCTEEAKKLIYVYPMTPLTELIKPGLDNILLKVFLGLEIVVDKTSPNLQYIGIAQSPERGLIDLYYDKAGCHSVYNVELKDQFDCLIISPGGSPYDDNLYHSLQSLFGTYSAVKKGGTIILTAECIEGIGSKEFTRLLGLRKKNVSESDLKNTNLSFEYAFLDFLERVRKYARIYLVSPIPRSIIQPFLDIKVFDTLQEAVQQAIRLHSRSLSVCIVPYGHFTRLTVGKEASLEAQQT